jgi:catechol 2,3-dioxygenase-like lactoylglutathione lyase family enzyme
MPIARLDHVNIRTANLEAMIDWYDRILGMPTGPRPDFPFPGAWIYAGDIAAVHLVGVASPPDPAGLQLEHFALTATGMADFLAHLAAHGVAHTLDPVPGFPIVQVNLHDCDGNHIHIDFAEHEAEGLL